MLFQFSSVFHCTWLRRTKGRFILPFTDICLEFTNFVEGLQVSIFFPHIITNLMNLFQHVEGWQYACPTWPSSRTLPRAARAACPLSRPRINQWETKESCSKGSGQGGLCCTHLIHAHVKIRQGVGASVKGGQQSGSCSEPITEEKYPSNQSCWSWNPRIYPVGQGCICIIYASWDILVPLRLCVFHDIKGLVKCLFYVHYLFKIFSAMKMAASLQDSASGFIEGCTSRISRSGNSISVWNLREVPHRVTLGETWPPTLCQRHFALTASAMPTMVTLL